MTLTERKSHLEVIRLMPDKPAQSVNQALKALDIEFKLVTSDNGKEFAKLNENHNRMIRRHLPKGIKKLQKNLWLTLNNG
ncbi:hypothetical protein SAMN05216438_1128 [Lactococcus garvieae]|uniref:Transposase n=1 Tax=Lactococcus garvieae TaxID=1363 RepID=A0A1I4I279_9LACT|nr:hypothetical protein [Lactococcus garvieae]SFL47921.1 hypothetical protein SAMN05216438_1128 [Lactococcus garvieae]